MALTDLRRRDWRRWRPTSLQEAVEGCVQYGQQHKRMTVDLIGELVSETRWTVYKWIQSGAIPARKIAGFESACGANFITHHLAACARKLVIDMPTGRVSGPRDINTLQQLLTTTVADLIAFADGKATSEQVHAQLTVALERLAFERANVVIHKQPELPLA